MLHVTVKAYDSIGQIPREAWGHLFQSSAPSWDYHLAAERMTARGFRFGALAAYAGEKLVGAAPMFRVDYRVDAPLSGRFHAIGDWLEEIAPSWITMPMLGLGSPISDECQIGVDRSLSAEAQDEVLGALIEGLSQHAAQDDVHVLLLKDVTDADSSWAQAALLRHKFSRIPSLPVATLDLPFESTEQYLTSLQPKVRQDLRRKMRQAASVRIEYRDRLDGIEQAIVDLYRQTRSHRKASYDIFDELPEGYFREVMSGLGGQARVQLLWVGDVLACFNLFIIERDRVVGRYLGMNYSMVRQYNLYFINWMAMVAFCIDNGFKRLQVGQSAYGTKVKLGCKLHRSWIYVKHTGAIRGPMFRLLSPYAAFDRMDPDLARLGANAPYA